MPQDERKHVYISKIPHFVRADEGEDEEYISEDTLSTAEAIVDSEEAIRKTVFDFLKFCPVEFDLIIEPPDTRYDESKNEMFLFINWYIIPKKQELFIKKMRICKWVFV